MMDATDDKIDVKHIYVSYLKKKKEKKMANQMGEKTALNICMQ